MLILLPLEILAAHLEQGFYSESCPSAEHIVWKALSAAVRKDPSIPAAIIRLYFHDCFVRGCDASVLLQTTSSKNPSELESFVNNGLRGLDVIHKAKAKVEAECPGIVSCADILAFAARDSTYKAGGIYYNVPSGRRDGTVSIESEVIEFLPHPFLDVPPMIKFFSNKSLSVKEMTALSGAHSIGSSHCAAFSSRLYTFNSSHPQDPTLDNKFANFLKKKCPVNATNSVVLDVVTPDRLDNQYYKNLKRNMGVLTTDQVLARNPLTAKIVKKYIDYPEVWIQDFADAMVHLGNLDVLTGRKGEIRNKCGAVNN
ncbi:Peroxidase [Heracleum sosnowskyi]|uniref:Peroxidase n=1 Tax=Heracleum sosnowskyi TaxID=360622 RepID=A0AAD8IJD4_9APIA|nr:Peroxidase [Heracleum sosnowskyi]